MSTGGERVPRGARRRLVLGVVATIGSVAVALTATIAPTPTFAAEPSPRLMAATELDGRDARGAQPSGSCTACHHMQPSFSHPVDFVPTTAVPTSLPLHGGRMTCTTCHDPVAARGHPDRAPRGATFLREDDSVTTMCGSCHDAMTGRAAAHGKGIPWAHLESAKKERRGGHGTDPESRSCMSCHDGVNATDAGAHSVRGAGSRGLPGELGDHPIGVPFGSPAQRGQPEIRLVSPSSLDRRIRLFDRMVGCGSCHNPYARSDALLVMSNYRSQLCLACHIE